MSVDTSGWSKGAADLASELKARVEAALHYLRSAKRWTDSLRQILGAATRIVTLLDGGSVASIEEARGIVVEVRDKLSEESLASSGDNDTARHFREAFVIADRLAGHFERATSAQGEHALLKKEPLPPEFSPREYLIVVAEDAGIGLTHSILTTALTGMHGVLLHMALGVAIGAGLGLVRYPAKHRLKIRSRSRKR